MEVTRPKSAVDPVDRLNRLASLLDSLDGTFKRLARKPVEDEKKLGEEFEELVESIGSFCEDLAVAAGALEEVSEQLDCDDERDAFLARIASEPDLAGEVKGNLAVAERGVNVVDRITEGVYRLTAQRKLLPRIAQVPVRAFIARALTSASVAVDRLNDLRGRLQGILGKVAEIGLDRQPDVADVPGIETPSPAPPEPEAPAPETAQNPPECGSAPHPKPAPAGAATKPIVSSERFARIRAALNRWARWRPFVQARFGDAIQIVSSAEEPAPHLICRFRDPEHPKALAQFQVWIDGEAATPHVEGLPRMWTAKTSGWLAGFLAAGAAAGFAIGEIVRYLTG